MDASTAIVTGIGLSQFTAGELQQGASVAGPIERLILLGIGEAAARSSALVEAVAMAAATNYARTLQWRPANRLTPRDLASEAVALAQTNGLESDVLERDRLEALGMGALLGVAQGSAEPPNVVVIRYGGRRRAGPILALVGKGITFDSGGISLKSTKDMRGMKADMSGAAAVIAAMGLIASRQPAMPVIGVVPLTENMPGGRALKPGDVVTSMSGKTIEVTNTDAEGRLVLADALWYATSLGATHIVDVATLTDAVGHALGHTATAAFSNDRGFLSRLYRASALAAERVWELPIHCEYDVVLRSTVADLQNLSDLPEAGAMAGAIFLQQFTAGRPWIHLDIGSSAINDRHELGQVVPLGPTGVMTRTFAHLPSFFDE